MSNVTNIVSGHSSWVTQGKGDGPLRAFCEVLAYHRLGSYHQLTFVAPDIAARTQPGQFLSVGVHGEGTLLRRPFSVAGVSTGGPWAGTLDLVFSDVGPGTAWLAGRRKHDVVDLVGPLGLSFPLPTEPTVCVLVGGGYGAAPLLYLARHLHAEGSRLDLVFGAASKDRLFKPMEAKRLAARTVFTTEDGSFGTEGRVTDVLRGVVEASGAGVLYGCGPMGMLAGVAEVAREHGIPCQVAVEEHMACGVGVCMTCVVPCRGASGVTNVRACVDGPVLDAAQVDWDAIASPAMADPRSSARTPAEPRLVRHAPAGDDPPSPPPHPGPLEAQDAGPDLDERQPREPGPSAGDLPQEPAPDAEASHAEAPDAQAAAEPARTDETADGRP